MDFDTLKLSTRYWVHSSSELLQEEPKVARAAAFDIQLPGFGVARFAGIRQSPTSACILTFFGMAIAARS